MRTFRWLIAISVVVGGIVNGVELYFALFVNPNTSQLPGRSPFPVVLLAIEEAGLLVALLSGVLYVISGRRGWQIALWVAAIILLLPSTLAAISSFPFFVPAFLPAAFLMFLAALFSLGASIGTGNADVERQPLRRPSSAPALPHRGPLLLGAAVAFLGGIAINFVLPASLVALLVALAISSIGATLIIRSPAAALVVPAVVWCGAVMANIVYGAANARLTDPIFWGGTLEYAAILIVIAVIPSLIGVAIGALLARWTLGGTA